MPYEKQGRVVKMICDVKDIPIFYEEYGEGVAMLCIHGYGVDRRLMTGCLEPLFARKTGYRRIYPDLPGMGKTPARDWLKNADQMLEIVIEFIEKTIGDEDFIIAGESYGGYLTLGLLRKMPAKIRGALFIAPVIKADNGQRTLPQNVASTMPPDAYDAYKHHIHPGLKAADDDFIARYRRDGYALSFENEISDMKFDMPVTFLTGRQDDIVGYADASVLMENYSKASFAVLDACGHNLQIESPAVFAALVDDLLWRIAR